MDRLALLVAFTVLTGETWICAGGSGLPGSRLPSPEQFSTPSAQTSVQMRVSALAAQGRDHGEFTGASRGYWAGGYAASADGSSAVYVMVIKAEQTLPEENGKIAPADQAQRPWWTSMPIVPTPTFLVRPVIEYTVSPFFGGTNQPVTGIHSFITSPPYVPPVPTYLVSPAPRYGLMTLPENGFVMAGSGFPSGNGFMPAPGGGFPSRSNGALPSAGNGFGLGGNGFTPAPGGGFGSGSR